MPNHIFISYSTIDGLDITRKLRDELEGGDPYYAVWYDKRDMAPADEWDEQILDAIKSCTCFLFIMTEDSTKPGSNCKPEIVKALRYKKPIVPILLQEGVEQPLLLGSREWIDFTGQFRAGTGKLHKFLREMELPEGALRLLNVGLDDAEHSFRLAKGEEENRIKVEIETLKTEIKHQQKIVDDPQAAQEQTQKNIEAGLQRERQPENPISAKASIKFINPPPGVAPNYFQDRIVETRQIVDFLNNDSQRLMTIVGRGGVGKTAMVCRLLKGLERGELPDELGAMKVEGIVYLSESGSHRVNFASIFYDLCKLLSNETAQELDAVYKNPQASTESKTRALLETFGSGGRVVLLLDNFESLVDDTDKACLIRDLELDEALRAFLNGAHTTVNIIVTTRVAPRTLNLIQPGRQRLLTLDEGLESPYAENILREMDSDGLMGLKSAPDDLLRRARERTRGYPRALEALFAILASDRYTTLEELLAMPTPENVVEVLVGEAFNRLDTNAQEVMQALAIYNRPVTPAAVDYLLAPQLPAIDSAPILQRLANMHFARKESGRYYLHPVDREYAISKVPEKQFITAENIERKEVLEALQQSTFSQPDLLKRAADYFAQARKPRAEWKKLDDLAAQLAEFDLRCAAGDYDTAADVLTDIDFAHLLLWGHYRLMIDSHLQVKDKIVDKNLRMSNLNGLGLAYYSIGKAKDAIDYYQQGLNVARETKDGSSESTFLGNIGTIHRDLGNLRQSINYFEKALNIAQEISNKQIQASALGNLGNVYDDLGETHKAIEFDKQSLKIKQEIGDRQGEENSLSRLGSYYTVLGDTHKAIEFYKQAVIIAQMIGDRSGEGGNLTCLGDVYSSLGESSRSIEFHEQAMVIIDDIGDRRGKAYSLNALGGVYFDLDKIEFSIKNLKEAIEVSDDILLPIVQNDSRRRLAQAYLLQNDLVKARATIEAALQYDVPGNNHNATALDGIIALREGERATAKEAFTKSIGQADEILIKTPDYYDALDAKGLALCGLAVCGGKQHIPAAIETFRAARKIAPHAGVVQRVLRLFDELVKCDEEGMLADVRKAAEGSETQT